MNKNISIIKIKSIFLKSNNELINDLFYTENRMVNLIENNKGHILIRNISIYKSTRIKSSSLLHLYQVPIKYYLQLILQDVPLLLHYPGKAKKLSYDTS